MHHFQHACLVARKNRFFLRSRTGSAGRSGSGGGHKYLQNAGRFSIILLLGYGYGEKTSSFQIPGVCNQWRGGGELRKRYCRVHDPRGASRLLLHLRSTLRIGTAVVKCCTLYPAEGFDGEKSELRLSRDIGGRDAIGCCITDHGRSEVGGPSADLRDSSASGKCGFRSGTCSDGHRLG